MKVKVTVVYEDNKGHDGRLRASRGMSWLLDFEGWKVLFDTGMRGKILLHNLERLGVSPDDIAVLVLSHAHMDHTGGITDLLSGRTSRDPLPVFAHPAVLETKRAARIMNIGFPDLDDDVRIKMHLHLHRSPVVINQYLHTTGEIFDRPYRDGTGWIMQHCIDGDWERDPILDDQSLVLETPDGLVLICGCCHAGLLNTMEHTTKLFQQDICAVLGGIHTRSYPKEDIEHISKVLENRFDSPRLGLGHCTGRKQLELLEERFGPELVAPLHVGWSYEFEAQASVRVKVIT